MKYQTLFDQFDAPDFEVKITQQPIVPQQRSTPTEQKVETESTQETVDIAAKQSPKKEEI